jgi:hypothetical protein
METVAKLEKLIAGWYESAPHLPVNGKKWLADNAWWIALVGVIVGTASIVWLLMLTFFTGVFFAAYTGVVGAALAGAGTLLVMITLALSSVALVLTAMAIAPLKAHKKRGWTLIFITVLLQVLSVAVSFMFDWNLFGLLYSLVFTAIGAYFLFEIRSYFGDMAKKPARPVATEKVNEK